MTPTQDELPVELQVRLAKAVADFIIMTGVPTNDAVAFAKVLAEIYGEWFVYRSVQDLAQQTAAWRAELLDRR